MSVHEYSYSIEKKLKATLKKTYKKDKKLYGAVMNKIEEIIENPHRYKPLRYGLKGFEACSSGEVLCLGV